MSSDNFYEQLGLSPDAEDIVISAAYRALAQRYHPDKWRGDPSEAHRRMREINAAYAVLSDKAKKAQYDQTRRDSSGSDYSEHDTQESSQAFNAALAEIETKWQVACSVYHDLAEIRAQLTTISISLAFAFVVGILESKAFSQRQKLAGQMEKQFLERYFGTNPRINAYARGLIMKGDKAAARQLNQLVDVLGSDVAPELLIARIESEVRGNKRPAPGKNSDERSKEIREPLNKFRFLWSDRVNNDGCWIA